MSKELGGEDIELKGQPLVLTPLASIYMAVHHKIDFELDNVFQVYSSP